MSKSKEPPHVVALQAEIERVSHLTPEGLRRITRDYPEVYDLLTALAWLTLAGDPTAAKVIDPESPYVSRDSSDSDGIAVVGKGKHQRATFRSAVSSDRYRSMQSWARWRIRRLARDVHRRLGAEDDVPAEQGPRCQKRLDDGSKCPMFGRRQAVGATHCRGCGEPFTAKT